jgi:hypothetical protein
MVKQHIFLQIWLQQKSQPIYTRKTYDYNKKIKSLGFLATNNPAKLLNITTIVNNKINKYISCLQ